MKRIKKVHNTEQMLHLFCNMTNADLEGFRNSQNNIYFSDGTLYSYGAHYPLAKKYSAFEGLQYKEIILINSDKSTVTTEKHKYQLRGSKKPGQWSFSVPDVQDPKNPDNILELENDIVEAIDGVLRGLKHWSMKEISGSIDNYNKYADAFKLKRFKPLDIDFELDLAELARVSSARHERNDAKRNERDKIERAERQAKRILENKESIEYTEKNLESWYQGHDVRQVLANGPDFRLHLLAEKNNHDYVRVVDNRIITHRGAEVPLTLALRMLAKYDQSLVYVVGEKIGEFRIDKSDQSDMQNPILEIGCHRINVNQVKEALKYSTSDKVLRLVK